MIKFDGNFDGELKINSVKFSKLVTKIVIKNNETSGKITLPVEFVDQEVVVALPQSKKIKKKRSRN